MKGRDGGRPTRRRVLALLSAAGASILLGRGASSAASVQDKPWIIDTHHHIYPPDFTAQNIKRIMDDYPGSSASFYMNWSPRASLDQMDQNYVATAVTSITSPGVWFGDNAAARVAARQCNEYGAQLKRDFPGRFGMFAALPLPDPDGSFEEMRYALDVLRLEGVGLLTSYQGKLLGDDAFAPIFDELNRRKAVVFVHPTMSCCGDPVAPVRSPIIEFPTDTARTITSLVYSSTFARCPDIRFIFSHGGGTMPMLIERIARVALTLKPEVRAAILPNGLEYELQRHYYDVAAVATNPVGMAAVFKLVPTTRLLFGSDVPFWTIKEIAGAVNGFDLPAAGIRAIQRDNAVRLFPVLA
jgi:predicted TIM-barrel fold metal-dependent hydrolase